MPMSFVHMSVAWLFAKLSLKDLSKQEWFFFLAGAIIPDFELIIDWFFKTDIHRTFTHSILFVAFAGILIYALTRLADFKERDSLKCATVFALGITTHLVLDMIGASIQLFWPLQCWVSLTSWKLGISVTALAVFDIFIGMAWLFFLAWRKKIQF